jgi:hypothetical protein
LEKLNWSCLGCPVRVFPVACDPDETFRKVPHFSLSKSGRDKHANDCNIVGLNHLIEKARKKPIRSNDILLGHLPYSVVFRESVSTVGEPGIKPGGQPAEGCLGSNYRDTFYQLQNISGGDPPKLHGCIFYGELRFRARPNYADPEKLILTLNRWARSEEDGERLYRLIIRWQDWRDQLRALFVQEVETTRQATNRRYDAPSRDRSKPFKSDIMIYFLSQQVEGSPTDFEVSDYRKVAIVVEPNGIITTTRTTAF